MVQFRGRILQPLHTDETKRSGDKAQWRQVVRRRYLFSRNKSNFSLQQRKADQSREVFLKEEALCPVMRGDPGMEIPNPLPSSSWSDLVSPPDPGLRGNQVKPPALRSAQGQDAGNV